MSAIEESVGLDREPAAGPVPISLGLGMQVHDHLIVGLRRGLYLKTKARCIDHRGRTIRLANPRDHPGQGDEFAIPIEIDDDLPSRDELRASLQKETGRRYVGHESQMLLRIIFDDTRHTLADPIRTALIIRVPHSDNNRPHKPLTEAPINRLRFFATTPSIQFRMGLEFFQPPHTHHDFLARTVRPAASRDHITSDYPTIHFAIPSFHRLARSQLPR